MLSCYVVILQGSFCLVASPSIRMRARARVYVCMCVWRSSVPSRPVPTRPDPSRFALVEDMLGSIEVDCVLWLTYGLNRIYLFYVSLMWCVRTTQFSFNRWVVRLKETRNVLRQK
jgi:hypothetical protein